MLARQNVLQVIAICEQYGIEITDFSKDLANKTVENTDHHKLGIHTRDNMHLVTAINLDAEVIISTDNHLIKLDNSIKNSRGNSIRCLDTNDARNVL